MTTADKLLKKYSLISGQVTQEDIRIILGQLENVLIAGVPGDIVEFGCYIGTTSLFIRRLLDTRHEVREFHVYDSFEGLPPKGREDESPVGTSFAAGQLAISKKQFIREFLRAQLQLPIIHKAWFNQLAERDIPERIAFAFLDGDFYRSIKISLQLVIPKMSRGGVIILHDYAREALPGVAKAIRECHLRPVNNTGLGVIHM